ncbi:transketolase [Paenibacillus sp. GSMTC-2017]|uniref:transketolase n=1 Tax=Paenibacillus sp. GSMTC-2017 TaxID=2794350 RepID=UPI0018D99B95|nr:transketolase [Paenibacillus sp. GSMTC-2017]MBH5320167.1 transketolase [Paenibacillus sp. GSMTC-2017]
MTTTIENLSINAIRTLTIDAVEKAAMGHPGMPMGAAPMGYALWTNAMKHNPKDPSWFNRDRFVLSAGHGSMLLYSLLHLSGYDLTMDDIKQFRQWGSRTPGHPEFGHTAGVEATTGPLGQGLSMAVGMAMAEAHLASVFNRDDASIIDHHTFVICGDGDLMEGVALESISLAGHLKLGKLVVLYDSNDISLDGELGMSFSEDVAAKFGACGWHYLRVDDQNDVAAISAAIASAKEETGRPTLIEVKTTIGFGSPNKAGKGGHGGTHGSPLGKEELKLTKEALGWPLEPDFFVPDEVYTHFEKVQEQGQQHQQAWNEQLDAYRKSYPELAAQLEQAISGELPEGWEASLPSFNEEDAAVSTRVASGQSINALAESMPLLIGGSADLASSNMTAMTKYSAFSNSNYGGRNLWFGVREFAMGAALNGMMLHGGVKVYGGTFLVFSDYLRGAIRLSSLMKLPVVYVFTHDSIAVGEDGPTHQPIEQIPSMRLIPNLTLFRPADANETAAAWGHALAAKEGPFVLALSRQNLPVLPNTKELASEGVSNGGYVLSETAQGADGAKLDIQLVATGSEVSLAMEVKAILESEGKRVRVISMPSKELFEMQSEEYRKAVVDPSVKANVAIEMAHPSGWESIVGSDGLLIGITQFGASAKANKVLEEYGFTADRVAARIRAKFL